MLSILFERGSFTWDKKEREAIKSELSILRNNPQTAAKSYAANKVYNLVKGKIEKTGNESPKRIKGLQKLYSFSAKQKRKHDKAFTKSNPKQYKSRGLLA